MFTFTPLLGAQSDSAASQSLLELDGGVKILVDVGWDEGFDAEKLLALEKHVPTISVILLTHPTIDHLGAFAHCCKHFPLFAKIPVYATTPVIALGRTLVHDLYASAPLAASIIPPSALAESLYSATFSKPGASPNILLQPPTVEEIAGFFSLINPLKYSQPHQPIPSPFSPPLNGLTITAYNAGHTLGGTIWHIQHGLESIVYAVDWNQAKENVLSGAAWLGGVGGGGGAEVIEQLHKPTALVCSSKGAERSHLAGGRRKRDDALLELVKQTISQGGSVLIPTDSSARMLELAYILERHWRTEASGANADLYKRTKVGLAGKSANATLRYARSMIEWMDEGILREMEAATSGEKARSKTETDGKQNGQDTPFNFRFVKLLERKSRLERMLASSNPSVILASDKSLEWGFSKDALRKLCADSRNVVILTERIANPRAGPAGIGRFMWELWKKQNESGEEGERGNIVESAGAESETNNVETARLEGEENLIYQQYLARRRQMHSTLQGDNTLSKDNDAAIADDNSSTTSESSEGSETEQQGRALNISATLTHARRKVGLTDEELGVNVLLRRKNVYDYDVRGKKGREKVFPFITKRNRGDEFGDMIRPEEYLRAEERDDVEGEGATEKKTETAVGQKRKWDEVAPKTMQNGRPTKGAGKKAKMEGGESGPTTDSNGDAHMNGNDSSSESEESDYEPDEATQEGPLKAVFTKQSIRLNMRIAYIDFSGLHEKRDLQMLIPLIRPRKLILVAGEAAETLSLASDCKHFLGSGEGGNLDVFTPVVGETVDASVDTNAWTLKLSRALVKKLAWQNVKGLGIVAVTGRLDAIYHELNGGADAGEENRAQKKQKRIEGPAIDEKSVTETTKAQEAEPVLDLPTANPTATSQVVTQPLHVGDLRLADLRRLMQASGHRAEFRGEGTLLVDGTVVVRKTASGRIEIEGGGYMMPDARGGPQQAYDGSFYAVKRKIYEGLAVIAGS